MSVNNYPGKNAYFNGNNLAGITGFVVYSIDIYKVPGRVNESYKLARTNGQKLVSQYYDAKQIIVKGKFALPGGLAAFEAARDVLLSYLGGTDAIFYTDVNGVPRQYKKVYCQDCVIENYSGGSADVTITFMANDPFGYDMGLTTLLNNITVTTNPDTESVSVGGTAPIQLPIVTITVNSFTLSGVFPATIGLSNNTNASGASLFQLFSPGDILVWDASLETFTWNGVLSSFYGTFPTLIPGTNSLAIGSASTSARNLSVTVQYQKRYT